MGVWVGEEGKVGDNRQSEVMKRREEKRGQRRGGEKLEVKGSGPEEREEEGQRGLGSGGQ